MATPNLKVVEYLGVAEHNDRFFYAEVPEPVDGWWAPYPDRPGLGLELNPAVVKQHAVS
jgi:L-alanine-DL-glutamate epimerase-like enolase superfamily enzyme